MVGMMRNLSLAMLAAGCGLILVAGCARQQSAAALTLPTPGVSVYPTAAVATADQACTVTGIRFLAQGGENSWSPDGKLIAYQSRDEAGVYQVYTIRPDGSDQRCLTCEPPAGAPAIDLHKGFPAWHPGGAYLVMQVEIAGHSTFKRFTEPGRGIYNDLWVTTADGKNWTRLTSYPLNGSAAVLNPRFSHDGKWLLWSERIGRVTSAEAFGLWQLDLAEFSIQGGIPMLGDITALRPGNAAFYEAHGFSPDDTTIYFTSDGDAAPNVFNIFSYNLVTSQLQNLTDQPDEWNEHAIASPRGNYLSYMSSSCCPGYDPARFSLLNLSELRSEIFLMRNDGSAPTQITHFNTPGYPESQFDPAVAIVSSWSPDGSQLAVGQFLVGRHFDEAAARRLWVIDFQGQCG